MMYLLKYYVCTLFFLLFIFSNITLDCRSNPNLFNLEIVYLLMADIFDYIPVITIFLFALGLVGVVVYEKTRTKQAEEAAAEKSN